MEHNNEIKNSKENFIHMPGKDTEAFAKFLQNDFQKEHPESINLLDKTLFIMTDNLVRSQVQMTVSDIYEYIHSFKNEKGKDIQVVFTGFLPEHYFDKRHKEVKEYLKLPNMHYIQFPFHPEDLIKILTAASTVETSKEDQKEVADQLRLHFKTTLLGKMKHDLPYAESSKQYGEPEHHEQIIAKARKEFDMHERTTDEQVLYFIKNTKLELEKVREGEVKGVFCDIDDTLLLRDGSINEKVLVLLSEYEKEGKEVSIWTGGDPALATERLQKTSAKKYPLVSKYDYIGATAEIVIDNVSEDKFYFQSGIKAKKFIRI